MLTREVVPIVLLESPYNPNHKLKNTVLLTTDLTKAVADEAIARRDSIIVTYRELSLSRPHTKQEDTKTPT